MTKKSSSPARQERVGRRLKANLRFKVYEVHFRAVWLKEGFFIRPYRLGSVICPLSVRFGENAGGTAEQDFFGFVPIFGTEPIFLEVYYERTVSANPPDRT